MNFNIPRKILIYSLLLFTFSSLISSVFSNEDSINKIRNLEDSDIPESDISTITKVDCNSTEDFAKCDIDHMTCEDQTLHLNCTCHEEYFSNFNNEVPGEKYCSIEKKKQLTAFLLELFVGFGAGHFYRHNYLMASLKLVAFFIGIYLICLFPLTAKCVTDCCDNDCCVIIVSIFFYLYALGLAFWYIWDLVYFGKNKYKDCSHGDAEIDFKPW